MNNSINQIINYIFNTPENTNYFVLISQLENLVQSDFSDLDLFIQGGSATGQIDEDLIIYGGSASMGGTGG